MAEERHPVNPSMPASAAAVALDDEQATRNLDIDIFLRDVEVSESFKVHYDQLLRQAKPISFPLFDLPFQKNIQFVGREEKLIQISEYLSQKNTLEITNTEPALMHVITGLGGVGKTQLAIEYAYQVKEKYKIVWFLNGQNIDADYLRLAAQLKVYGENPKEIIERTKLKLQELGSYLLIIDDAENYETIKTYLPQTGNNGHVLITTRHRLASQKMLELGIFALEEGLAYFEKITDFNANEIEDVIYLIDKLLGFLPLALTQAGAFIKQTGISIKEYIQFFETNLQELWETEEKARDYSQTIAVTWEITIKQVKQKYPEAEELLRGMSCLAPMPNLIDQKWLSKLVADELIRLNVLAELAHYSIIEMHQKPNNFLVHSLIQLILFEDIPNEKKPYYFQQLYSVLKEQYVDNLSKNTQINLLLPHVENVSNCAKVWLKKRINLVSDVQEQQKQLILNLLNLLADCYSALNKVGEEKSVRDQMLSIKNELNIETDVEVAKALKDLENIDKFFLSNNMADTTKIYEYKQLLEHVSKIFEEHKQYGKVHPLFAKVLVNLGCIEGALGNIKGQTSLLEQALQIQENYYGGNHLEVTRTLDNLANAYGVLGNPLKQKTLLEQALIILQKHYGEDHPLVAQTLMNLGIAYGNLGKLEKQKTLLERALSIQEKTYGTNHQSVAKTLVNLGNAYGALGDVQKKKILLERALEIKEEIYSMDHPEVAITLTNLGNVYGALGDIHQQKKLQKRALLILEKYYGSEHPDIAKILVNLANVHSALGNIEEQKSLLKRALMIEEKHYGLEHPEVARTLMSLSGVYAVLGDASIAKKYLEQALVIFKAHNGSDSLEVGMALVNLSKISTQLKQLEKGKVYAEQAYQIFSRKVGLLHPYAKIAKQTLDNITQMLLQTNQQDADSKVTFKR